MKVMASKILQTIFPCRRVGKRDSTALTLNKSWSLPIPRFPLTQSISPHILLHKRLTIYNPMSLTLQYDLVSFPPRTYQSGTSDPLKNAIASPFFVIIGAIPINSLPALPTTLCSSMAIFAGEFEKRLCSALSNREICQARNSPVVSMRYFARLEAQ
jgi:hypothetical protein